MARLSNSDKLVAVLSLMINDVVVANRENYEEFNTS